jgi:hypothetical protein
MRAQIAVPAHIVAGYAVVGVSHGKERPDKGNMYEAVDPRKVSVRDLPSTISCHRSILDRAPWRIRGQVVPGESGELAVCAGRRAWRSEVDVRTHNPPVLGSIPSRPTYPDLRITVVPCFARERRLRFWLRFASGSGHSMLPSRSTASRVSGSVGSV